MQYILTKKEYDDLRAVQQTSLNTSKKKLQDLATLAANHIPVKRNWLPKDAKPEPWGCILDEETSSECCDDCPAKIICPHEDKEYSKWVTIKVT